MRLSRFRLFAPLVGTMLAITGTVVLLDTACEHGEPSHMVVDSGGERLAA
jgi:hypothetical protein